MAKKKTVKKVAKKSVISGTSDELLGELHEMIAQTNKRIDNIIAAHEGCRKLKGL